MIRKRQSAVVGTAMLVALHLPVKPAGKDDISIVDLYGLRSVSAQAVRDAIGESPEPSETLVEKLRAIPGVSDARLTLVCCVEGRSVLFVGIVEPGSPAPSRIRPRPDGERKLPAEFGQAYTEFLDALFSAVQDGRVREDRSEGHAFSEDPAVRAAQEKFVGLSRDNVELLREVLVTSRYDEDRAVAAHIIAYAQDKMAVLPDLLQATSDADSTVRNNAVRAIAVLSDYAKNEPDILQRIDPEPFIAMLSSPEWSDRNKAIGVLLGLTEQRDPRWAARFRGDALNSLAEMARWQSPGHARDAFELLGRIAGSSNGEITRAWSTETRDGWIDEAVAKTQREAAPLPASPPTTEDDAADSPIRIARSLVDALNTADTDALLELFAPDATFFTPFDGAPGRIEGQEAIARLFESFFAPLRKNGDGPRYTNLSPRDLLVQTYGDAAIVTFHLGSLPDGPPDQAYSVSRRSLVMIRSTDRWLIAHLHASNIMIPVAEPD